MPEFTGTESAADVLKAVLDSDTFQTALSSSPFRAEITYQGDIPILRFEAKVKNNLGEFLCFYRLDKMTENVFSECGGIFDDVATKGLFGEVEALEREQAVRGLAFYAMQAMVTRLMLLQVALFEESFSETMCLTAGSLFSILADAYEKAGAWAPAKAAKEGARTLLDETIATAAKKRRDMLVTLLNTLPAIHIPTKSGRPLGSVKPENVKAQEAAEYEKKIETAIRKLITAKGKMPTKRAVAKELGIGGVSAGGTDSTLTNFGRKLRGLKIDYDAIVERVKVDK